MRLPVGQRAIIAGFRIKKKAEQAAQALQEQGIEDISVERYSLYPPDEFEKRLHNPITGDYPGLAEGVFDAGMDRDASIMASATPSASGMSDGNDENVGTDVVLTAVVTEQQYEEAANIVTRLGGEF